MSGEDETEDGAAEVTPILPATPPLPDPLAKSVAESYADILKEPVPERLTDLLDAIRRLENGQRKSS